MEQLENLLKQQNVKDKALKLEDVGGDVTGFRVVGKRNSLSGAAAAAAMGAEVTL